MRWPYRSCVCALAVVLSTCASYAQDIHDAVKNGRIEEVRRLITTDSSLIRITTEAGDTPLHLACRGGKLDITRLLIDAGADINAANKQNMTPLRSAIHAMQVEVAELLLARGAKTDDRHPMFGSVMNQAFSVTCQRDGDTKLVETLIARGVALDGGQTDALGMSPLDWAVHFGNPGMAQLAIEHGANVNLVCQRLGRPPLVGAVSKGNGELVSLLLERGANTSIADQDGNPPIFYAIGHGRTSILDELLAHGASNDFIEPHYGRSLVHMAAIKGFGDVAKTLVTDGADINAVDKAGNTPLFYAAKYGNRSVADYLVARGAARPQDLIENYGDSPWLTENMDAGQASVWYLNNRGWAVKTANHLLVFDAEEFEVRRPDNPCLANGFLTAEEIGQQNVMGLYSCYHGNPGEPAYIHTLAESLKKVAFVHLLDDPWRGSPNTTYLKGDADTNVADLRIHTIDIPSGMPMLAYMCNTGDLTIYYQAFATDDPGKLRQNYEFLSRSTDTVDIAFLPVPDPEQEESDVKLFLERFPTRAIVLLDSNRREYLFPDVARRIADWGFPTEVFCAENPGDHFRYQPSVK